MITLANAEERSAQSNGKFALPSPDERRTLKPGDYAKVVFESEAGGERMWLRVEVVITEGRYLGVLDNTPVLTDLSKGDLIEFGAEHVCQILALRS